MFATASATAPRHAPHGAASAYRQMGVETGVTGASPHQLVLMLFDAFADSVTQARGAMRSRQVEHKGRAISRALRIVNEGLREGLNLRQGGGLAADLSDLYGYVTLRLMQANLANDEAALDECQRLIAPLREAWAAIGEERTAGGHDERLQSAMGLA